MLDFRGHRRLARACVLLNLVHASCGEEFTVSGLSNFLHCSVDGKIQTPCSTCSGCGDPSVLTAEQGKAGGSANIRSGNPLNGDYRGETAVRAHVWGVRLCECVCAARRAAQLHWSAPDWHDPLPSRPTPRPVLV